MPRRLPRAVVRASPTVAACAALPRARVRRWLEYAFSASLLISLAVQLTTMQGEEMFSFNPYKILGVEEGAEMSEVKKAYRRLSLQHHPDKATPGDKTAAVCVFYFVGETF